MKHLNITVVGKVQRIGLRYQIKQAAEDRNLKGYARNLRDGTVSIELEGNEASINKFLEWLKMSPGLSDVKELEVSEGKILNYREFQVY